MRLKHKLLSSFAAAAMALSAHPSDSMAQTSIDNATFPDEAFRSWITSNIPGAEDGLLTTEELTAVQTLDINVGCDLKGIQTFTSLRRLSVRQWGQGSACSTLNIDGLDSISYVSVSSDQLESISLRGCTSIDSLVVNKSQVGKTVKVSGLTDCQSPEYLAIRGGDFGTHLDLSEYKSFKTIDLRQSVGLDTLDLPTIADSIMVDSAQIAHLNIKYSPQYNFLSCSHNRLTAFNLRGACVSKLGDISNQVSYVDAKIEPDGTKWLTFDIDKEFQTVYMSDLLTGGQSGSPTRLSYENGYRFGVDRSLILVEDENLIGQKITYNYKVNCSCHSDARMDVTIILATIDAAPEPEPEPTPEPEPEPEPTPEPSEPHWICP